METPMLERVLDCAEVFDPVLPAHTKAAREELADLRASDVRALHAELVAHGMEGMSSEVGWTLMQREVAEKMADELAALRQRASDLEVMLRASLCRHPSLRAIFQPRMSGEAYLLRHPERGGREEDLIKLYDDGTGLPLLTDDARRALAAKEGE